MKVGDKVIALSDSPTEQSQFRKKGSVYIVNDITFCPFCCINLVNIGQRTNLQAVQCKCNTMLHTRGLMWTPTSEFILYSNREKEMYNAVDREDYEFAAILRDL